MGNGIKLACHCEPVRGSNSVNTVKTAEIVGKWQEKETPSVYLTLNKDNTGEMSSGGWAIKLNWTYSKKTNAVTMEINGMGSSTAIYDPINDTISRDGVVICTQFSGHCHFNQTIN